MLHAPTALRRLRAQSLTDPPNASALATAISLGAIQAQDYAQSLWAIGVRTAGMTAALVEQAVIDRQILRTWTMRGTIHFVPARDASWIVALCATRQIRAAALMHRHLGLDAATFARAGDLFREQLQIPVSRPDIFAMLQRNGIATDGQRGYHLLVYHAQSSLIALGPMAGKQPTAVLLDTWVRDPVRLSLDDALVEFARRYVTSHGPATIADFANWAGLTLTEARRGHDAIRASLVENSLHGISHWMHAAVAGTDTDKSAAPLLLLPAFDEYLLGYKDRGAVLPDEYSGRVTPGKNGVFKMLLVEHGEVTGIWSRTVRTKGVELELAFFGPGRRRRKATIDEACERYARFLGLPVVRRTLV